MLGENETEDSKSGAVYVSGVKNAEEAPGRAPAAKPSERLLGNEAGRGNPIEELSGERFENKTDKEDTAAPGQESTEEANSGGSFGEKPPAADSSGSTAGNPEAASRDDILSTVTPEEDALTARETIRDMVAGIIFFSLIFAGAGCIIMGEDRLRWVFGVLLGGFTAAVLLRHLYVTIDRALEMDEAAAEKYTKRSAVKRLLIAAAAFLAGGVLPQVFHIIGVLLGTFSLKFSAYLQPLTHKLIKFLSKGG